jgi:hypothetical protein
LYQYFFIGDLLSQLELEELAFTYYKRCFHKASRG